MYKIIAAINSMISNQQLITHTIKQDSEIFFVYDSKFKWSIKKTRGGDLLLYYYPGNEPLQDLSLQEPWGTAADCVVYSTKELKSQEAVESFSELHQVVQKKLYDIDEVLDSIINTAA